MNFSHQEVNLVAVFLNNPKEHLFSQNLSMLFAKKKKQQTKKIYPKE